MVRVGDSRKAADPSLSQAALDRLDAAAARVAAAAGDPAILTLDVAMNPSAGSDARIQEPVGVARAMNSHSFRGLGLPYVATPQLLRYYGIDPATVDDGTELLTSLGGDVLLLDQKMRPDVANAGSGVQRVDLSSYTSGPRALVTEGALHQHGWVRARAGWLLESSTPLSAAQVSAARTAAGNAGLTIEARSAQNGLTTLRTVATAVGALLALAIVAMTIGLIRGEAAGDLRTLTATGATGHTRRTLTASTAGALALLGVVQGTAGAYLALLAGYHADLALLARPPVAQLLVLAIGLPVVAAGAGWLLAGREPHTFARQALD
jgi:putative ABC transport system permease protein